MESNKEFFDRMIKENHFTNKIKNDLGPESEEDFAIEKEGEQDA